MDRENFSHLQQLAGGAGKHILMLSDFLESDPQWPRDVPDPYYGEADGFDYVLDMIEAACPAILQKLSEES